MKEEGTLLRRPALLLLVGGRFGYRFSGPIRLFRFSVFRSCPCRSCKLRGRRERRFVLPVQLVKLGQMYRERGLRTTSEPYGG